MKKLRSASKPITFAIPYGAGAPKIARQSKLPLDEARRIILARKQAFQQVEVKKKEVADNCTARWKKGFRPAYVPLWTGRRVIVPVGIDKKTQQEYVVTYKYWNYLQQGGVAEMVARAKVRAYQMLMA
jgi:DNA polymerase I-like protein with 3'-5' exonuclease and polymerase domains